MKNRITLLAVCTICLFSSKFLAAQDITCSPNAGYTIMPNNITVKSGYYTAETDPCLLMDGDSGSRWNGLSISKAQPFAIEFDLGEKKLFDQLAINWRRSNSRYFIFYIEVSDDGVDFERIETTNGTGIKDDDYIRSAITDEDNDFQSITFEYGHNVRYIRYIAHGAEFPITYDYNPQNEFRDFEIVYAGTATEEDQDSDSTGGVWNLPSDSQDINYTSGNVGIGTTNIDGWKLAVAGKIRAEEIKVYTDWADYVFLKDYKLPTLEEVEQHIQEKGHLINIPSASEVTANGIELGEMNKLLLEKIEELTLYMLQQEKRITELEKLDK